MSNPLTLAALPAPVRWLVNSISKLHVLSRWYDEWLAGPQGDATAFLDYTLAKTGIQFEVTNPNALIAIPQDVPLIIVANHPLGGLEGMLLSRLLLRVRPDLKVLTNEMLLSFKEFDELFIGVDVLNPNKQAQNAKGMRRISKHLSQNGALLIFPAGTVSELSLKTRQISDAPWQDIVGRLAMRYNAQCLPIYVTGKNSGLFYLSALIHPRFRTLLLPRAMISKQGECIRATVGQCIALDKAAMSPAAATDYLRLNCELLAAPNVAAHSFKKAVHVRPVNSETLALQLQFLNAYKVAEKNEFCVYCAPFEALGPIADVLAAAREKTFRCAGEGTGLAADIDKFDPHYWHIFVWDIKAQQLVGSYRAVNTKTAVANKGLGGLYSHSLFDYDQRFLNTLGGAIEVGRSFITEPYQNNHHALDLLWRGLGAFMVQNPECHTFFGCVSISQTFAPMLRALLVDTLLEGYAADGVQRALVKPLRPFKYQQRFWAPELIQALTSMADINKLLGGVNVQLRVPALIRHYIALKGKFVEFTVNKGFNESLDGLIFVDLRQTPSRYIARYLGAENAQAFNHRWRQKNAA